MMKKILIAILLLWSSVAWGASGDTLAVFTVNAADAPTQSVFATFDVRSGASPTMMLDFDASVTEYVTFKSVMPAHYSNAGVKVIMHFSTGAVTSGSVVWGAAFENLSGATGFAETLYSGTSVAGTSHQLATTTINIGDAGPMDSVDDDVVYRLMVLRAVGGIQTCGACNDDAAGDAELQVVHIIEQ